MQTCLLSCSSTDQGVGGGADEPGGVGEDQRRIKCGVSAHPQQGSTVRVHNHLSEIPFYISTYWTGAL